MSERLEKIPEVPTFSKRLVPHSEHWQKTEDDLLLQLEGRKDLVIRPLQWEHMIEKRRWHAKEFGEVSAEEFAALSKAHFDELREYGIHAPISFVVAGARNGEETRKEVFAIVHNVTPDERPDMHLMRNAYLSLGDALLRYYANVYEKETSFLADLAKTEQYVYGKKDGDTEDALYLVDGTPYIYWSPYMLRKTLVALASRLEDERAYFKDESFGALKEKTQDLITRIDQGLDAE